MKKVVDGKQRYRNYDGYDWQKRKISMQQRWTLDLYHMRLHAYTFCLHTYISKQTYTPRTVRWNIGFLRLKGSVKGETYHLPLRRNQDSKTNRFSFQRYSFRIL